MGVMIEDGAKGADLIRSKRGVSMCFSDVSQYIDAESLVSPGTSWRVASLA